MGDVQPLVGVVMGSDSDWPVMEEAAKVLPGEDWMLRPRLERLPRAVRAVGGDPAR